MPKKDNDESTILNFKAQVLPELPLKTAVKILTQTEGRGLKQNTRATKGIIDACMFGYPYVERWGNKYVGDMLDDLMCLSISVNGQGRRDVIDSLDAGGVVPDAYYTGGNPPRDRDTGYLRSVD